MECPALERYRDYDIIERNDKSMEDRMVDLLFFKGNFHEVGIMIKRLWMERRRLLTSIKERNKQRLRRFNQRMNPPTEINMRHSNPGPRTGLHDNRVSYTL